MIRSRILILRNAFLLSLALLILFNYLQIQDVNGGSFGVYPRNQTPLGMPYEVWVEIFWNWYASLLNAPGTQTIVGLGEGKCLINDAGPAVTLLDTAVGGTNSQNCSIQSDQGIFINLWSGECETATQGYERATYEKLLQCAKDLNLGRVTGKVFVDGTLVANLLVENLKPITLSNVTEVVTPLFSFTYPVGTHLMTPKFGTFPAAAHGWFVFLKPLPPGDHKITYSIDVKPIGGGGGAKATAEITYNLKVT